MKAELVQKREEVAGVWTFEFEAEEPVTWQAGQYMRYKIEDPSPDERKVDRFFTIASAPYEGRLQITTRIDPEKGSTFKKDLLKLEVGQEIEAAGPMGAFRVEDSSKELVFIAGGIGITPFRSILLDLDHKNLPINVTLLYANRNEDIVFKEELDKLIEKHPTLKIKYVLDPEKITEEVIKANVPDLQTPVFYLSGPEPMVKAFGPMLEGMGVSEGNINTDFFPGYKGI